VDKKEAKKTLLWGMVPLEIRSAQRDVEMAVIAWEIACSWALEPEYAGRLAVVFRQRLSGQA